jgi:regulatory protein
MQVPLLGNWPRSDQLGASNGRTILKTMSLRSRSKTPLPAGAQHDPAAIRLAAITLLARRDFASGELGEQLMARGFAAEVVRAVLAELVAEGLFSEGRYVENYVASRAGRGQGPARIGAELRKNGVPEPLIEQGLQAADWVALARKVRRAKFGAEPPQGWAEKARQARFLQYRGFSADHIRAATGADPDFD